MSRRRTHVFIIGGHAFLPDSDPEHKGCYIRTDACVPFVACPDCAAKPMEFCRSHTGALWRGGTHAKRRRAFMVWKRSADLQRSALVFHVGGQAVTGRGRRA